MFSSLFALLYLLLVTPNLAQTVASTTTKCTTEYGNSSLSVVPSYTTTITTTLTSKIKVFSFPVKTTVAPMVTRTTTNRETATTARTADQETETSTETSLFEETETSTTTYTSVYTNTHVTTTHSTITISTSSGFIPVNSVPGNPPARKRALGNQAKDYDGLDMPGKGGYRFRRVASSYPASVVCRATARVSTTITVTVEVSKTFTKTAAGPTSLKTITSVYTDEKVEHPNGFTETVTESVTNSYTELWYTEDYLETITTSTETAIAAATFYPGCMPDNILSTINGQPINHISYDNYPGDVSGGEFISDVKTSVQCCQACQRSPVCSTYFFWVEPDRIGCIMWYVNTCQPTRLNAYYDHYRLFDEHPEYYGNRNYTVGTGNCGRLYYRDVDPEPP